jgi:hypothetical protein
MDDWQIEAQKSPAWSHFLTWYGLDSKRVFHLPEKFMYRWDAFQAGVIVGQGLVAETNRLHNEGE